MDFSLAWALDFVRVLGHAYRMPMHMGHAWPALCINPDGPSVINACHPIHASTQIPLCKMSDVGTGTSQEVSVQYYSTVPYQFSAPHVMIVVGQVH